MDQTSAGILRDQNKLRLLLPIEPTHDELLRYPFLQGHGGVGTIGRHPIFIHYCDCFTFYRLASSSLLLLEANKENIPPQKYKTQLDELTKRRDSLLAALNGLEWAHADSDPKQVYVQDLMQGGRYYNFEKANTKK